MVSVRIASSREATVYSLTLKAPKIAADDILVLLLSFEENKA